MHIDLYTKVVLTVISISLAIIAIQQLAGQASAQFQCGARITPCFVVYPTGEAPCLQLRPCFVTTAPRQPVEVYGRVLSP